ncbi:MAG TPA: transglycosylase domain-containing protein [Marmoricola sp.]|nr:transglycosylase domain-containing protein [Marmoricola sp.]
MWLRRLLIVGLVCALVGVGVFYFAYRATTIPDPNRAFQAQTTSVYYADGKHELGRFAVQNRESIPLTEVPKVMQEAIVAAEDRTFWTNKGIDPKGILRAAFSNAKGNATQGASTITQQYVKLLYLSQERTLQRKVKEAFLSLKIQQERSKTAILEGYLNTVYFARGAYGIEAAAQAWFGIPAKRLNLRQAVMLAAIVNSPSSLSPDNGKDAREALLGRMSYIYNGMAETGAITQAQADKAKGHLPKRVKPNTEDKYGGQRGFMLHMVKDELLRLGFDETEIEGGGLKVTTTFTQKAMRAAKEAVTEVRPEGLKGLHVATASVDVKSGALLGFFGGQNYLKSQLNWAKLGGAPGSAFKPFALAAGIKDGFSLKSTFQGNSPYEFPDGSTVVNEGPGDGHDYGAAVSLVKATEDSINTAYIDLTMSMDHGPEKIKKTAIAMGIPKNAPGLKANAGISLGSATISPINMANAYATIANGGVHHDWYIIEKVSRKSDGKTLWKAPHRKNRVLSEDISADVSYALQQVVKNGTGAAAQGLGRPAAGKTGTATNAEDHVSSSWFVGYTPQVATAVMYVRGKGNEALDGFLPSYFGADYPADTWTALMTRLMDGVPVEDFPPPAYVEGDPPTEGHEPYTPPPPPPSPTEEPEPTKNGTCDPKYGYPDDPDCKKPKPTPTPTPTPSPTPEPKPTSDGECSLVPGDPDCKGPSPSPSSSPTSSATTEPQNGGSGGGSGR